MARSSASLFWVVAPVMVLAMTASSQALFAAGGPTVRPAAPLDNPIAYQRLEWRVDPGREYDNPFDPAQISIDATFKGPDGRTMLVPAYWDGPNGFVIRFCAPQPGKWEMSIAVKDRDGSRTSEPSSFDVSPSKNRGFIRRDQRSTRYLRFDNGEPYFMIGLNMAWPGPEGLESYRHDFAALSRAGGNFARVWMAQPKMETVQVGLGRYDLSACENYDRLLELAEASGIYCMVTFTNYRDLRDKDEWGPAGWPIMPYNAANGGPATRPSDFGTNPECLRLYRQRLRYIVARWGSFTHVAFWEFFNEQSFTLANIPPAWTLGMARYLKSVDPYQHLVTTSFGPGAQREVWQSPDIDLTQMHMYPGESAHDDSGVVSASAMAHEEFHKPYLVGEIGIHHLGSDLKYDPTGAATNLHNTVWAGMMSGAAGGACNWWWDSYVRKLDLWQTYHGASVFAAQIDWPRKDFRPLDVPPVMCGDADAAPETFTDILVPAAGVWGKHHGRVIEVLPNGQTRLTLPQYLMGPVKPDLRTPTILHVQLPQDSTMTIHVSKVSDFATLRILVDGKAQKDLMFSALPGAPEQEKTEQLDPKIYQATINRDYPLELPAGTHSIELSVVGGDWVSLESVSFSGARSSRYAQIDVIALQEPASGETIAWLRHQQSCWYNDLHQLKPKPISGALVQVPVTHDGDFRIQWWDTRKGEMVREDRVRAAKQCLRLVAPTIERDVALRVIPSESGASASQ
jgi:hypothetical protein